MLRRQFIRGLAAMLITVNTTLGFSTPSLPEPVYQRHYSIWDDLQPHQGLLKSLSMDLNQTEGAFK